MEQLTQTISNLVGIMLGLVGVVGCHVPRYEASANCKTPLTSSYQRIFREIRHMIRLAIAPPTNATKVREP